MNNIITQKIMHLTDLHFNPLHRIPQSRSSKFHAQIREKWGNVCSIIKEEGIDFGIISGDIFHLKNPKIYCPEDILYYSEMIEQTEIDWVTIPGNHDLPESSLDQIEKSPYILLVKATKNLKSLATYTKLEDSKTWYFPTFTYPKESKNLIPINLHGYPYRSLRHTLGDLDFINERIGNYQGFNILLLHMDILVDPNIFLFWPVAGYDSILDKLLNVDLICLGHIHQSFPVYKRINPITKKVQMVSKPWSFTRVAKDYFNKTDIYEKLHKPSYSLITIEQSPDNFKVNVEYKELKFSSFNKAFKRDILKRQLENNIEIKLFIDQIKNKFGDVGEAFKVIDPEEYLKDVQMLDEIRNTIEKYLEEKE
jgi:DNA repair exonuclease SbcCD nuclease subunit